MCQRKEPETEQKPATEEPRWSSVGRVLRSVPSTHDRDSGAVSRDRDKAHLPPIDQSKPVVAGVGRA